MRFRFNSLSCFRSESRLSRRIANADISGKESKFLIGEGYSVHDLDLRPLLELRHEGVGILAEVRCQTAELGRELRGR